MGLKKKKRQYQYGTGIELILEMASIFAIWYLAFIRSPSRFNNLETISFSQGPIFEPDNFLKLFVPVPNRIVYERQGLQEEWVDIKVIFEKTYYYAY